MLPIHNSLAEYVDFHQFKSLVAAYNDNGGLVPPVSRWAASEVVELARLVGASHQSSSEQRYEVELLKYRVLQAQGVSPAPALLSPASLASSPVIIPAPLLASPSPAALAPTPTPTTLPSPAQSPVDSLVESAAPSPSSPDLLAAAVITTAQLKASNAELASIKLEIETVRRQLTALRMQVADAAARDDARWNRERNAMFWAMAGYDWLPVASLQGPIPSNLPPITSLAAFNTLDRPSLVAWARYYSGAAHARLIDRVALHSERDDAFLRRLVGIGIGVALGDPGAGDAGLVFPLWWWHV
ncbi:uncharacterized protein LOC62_04G006029 [Vanrija pseudolonga]|uniref:Uncharacterized protein n=1 Tax=Vanrija pseudolonga TaxID=143232 RepID=A0AAF1BLS0_9TREE|nr:hypothetical protein LOC62_04G006029 [Vanrija pseudolonga]